MKKLLSLVAVALTSIITTTAFAASPNSVIKYKSEYEVLVNDRAFGDSILSHEYDEATQVGVITFKGALTKLPCEAFEDGSVEWISLPESLQDVDDRAFMCCYTKEFRGKFAADNGRCLIVNGKLIRCNVDPGVKDYTVPNSVTKICAVAFMYTDITSITIPESVTEIHGQAFVYACERLIMKSSKAPNVYGAELHSEEGTDVPVFSIKVYVPKGAAANYKSARYWKSVKDQIFEY